jgi:hypothetical protein
MPGLLYQDPTSQGILAAGSALLQAGSPSFMPQSLGGALGQAGNAFLGGMRSAQSMNQQQALIDLEKQKGDMLQAQMTELKRKADLDAARQAMLSQYFGRLGGQTASQGALAQGAQVGDVGPTLTNAARMEAPQASQGPNINPADLIPLAASGVNVEPFLKIRDAMKPTYQTAAPGQTILRETPTGLTTAFTAPNRDESDKLKDVLTAAGIPPDSPQGQKLFSALASKMATHPAPIQVTTNVSTEKKYGEQFAGKVAESDVTMRDAAIKAPDLAERANRIKEVLAGGKVLTGTGADYRLALGKAMNLVGANDGETVANTETLATSMAQNTLDAIKASGLGSGSGFSNADRDFLEKAVGGKITLQSETINRLADLAHRAAAKSAEKWNTRVKSIPPEVLQGTGLSADPIGVAPLYTPQNQQPTTAPRKYNPKTGRIE